MYTPFKNGLIICYWNCRYQHPVFCNEASEFCSHIQSGSTVSDTFECNRAIPVSILEMFAVLNAANICFVFTYSYLYCTIYCVYISAQRNDVYVYRMLPMKCAVLHCVTV
jgi:hypothetical protein